ncbi:hypothetical protein RDI58_011021 [Solanum bulbocastanum]|uniref:Uncharacterized protein n=1 Tax=Solanum bulbocastanum TaxID=147425 RepID=A0AAN8TRN8_SOLBU
MENCFPSKCMSCTEE